MVTQLGSSRISAAAAPEEANAAAAALLGDSPEPFTPVIMPEPVSGLVTLPGGVMLPEGGRVVEAEVRELTGADEEALSKSDGGTNFGRFIQITLQRGTLRIGDWEPPDRSLLDSLLLGDRDTLLLAIRKATYGNEMPHTARCLACGEVLDIVLDLNTDIPMKELENPENRRFTVPLRRGVAVVRLPTGADQNVVLNMKGKTVPEMNTELLSRCVIEINGEPVASRPEPVRALGMADRQTLLTFFTDTQPGPKYEGVKVPCASCERDVPLNIDLADLFRG